MAYYHALLRCLVLYLIRYSTSKFIYQQYLLVIYLHGFQLLISYLSFLKKLVTLFADCFLVKLIVLEGRCHGVLVREDLI